MLYAKCDCGQYEEFKDPNNLKSKLFSRTAKLYVLKCKNCKELHRVHFKSAPARTLSKLQKIATARNYLSFVLAGFYKPVNETYMTEAELVCWNDIKESVERMKAIHKKGNKYFGLKVKDDG